MLCEASPTNVCLSYGDKKHNWKHTLLHGPLFYIHCHFTPQSFVVYTLSWTLWNHISNVQFVVQSMTHTSGNDYIPHEVLAWMNFVRCSFLRWSGVGFQFYGATKWWCHNWGDPPKSFISNLSDSKFSKFWIDYVTIWFLVGVIIVMIYISM